MTGRTALAAPLRGMLWMLAQAASMCAMMAAARHLNLEGMSSHQVAFFRGLMGLLVMLPWLAGMSGFLYLGAALVLGAIFMMYAVKLKFYPNDRLPMQTFSYSIVYLVGIFSALLLDHWL